MRALVLDLLRRVGLLALGVLVAAAPLWGLLGWLAPELEGPPPQLTQWAQIGVALLALALALAPDRALRVRWLRILEQPEETGAPGLRVELASGFVTSLVERTARSFAGVAGARAAISLRRPGWRVRCRLSLHPDANPALLSEAVRGGLAHRLLEITGLPVERLELTLVPAQHAKSVR